MPTLRRFLQDETAASAIEYALIASLISVAIIGASLALGINLSNAFKRVSDAILDVVT